MDVLPVTAERLGDLARLFGTNRITTGCHCMWFLVPAKECEAGWGEANRARFEDLTDAADEPVGVLAYRDGQPVGWCAAGPRRRFARALRSPLLKARDPGEDDRVWLVPCFYVRREARGAGLTRAMLESAVALAAGHGATAVEGFPLNLAKPRSTAEAYVGVEPLFASCGFSVVSRPSAARVLMRRELPTAAR